MDSVSYYYSLRESHKQHDAFDKALYYNNKMVSLLENSSRVEDLAHGLNQGAALNINVGNYEAALKQAQRALELGLKLKSKEIEANAYANFGSIYTQRTMYKTARENYQVALDILKKLHGESDPSVMRIYQGIREAYALERQMEQAMEYDLLLLDFYRRRYGENDPNVAEAYFNISTYYLNNRDGQKSADYCLKALAIFRKTSGEKSMKVAAVYRNLGRSYILMGKFDDVIQSQERGLAIYKELVGERNPRIILFYWNMGMAYGHLGQPEKAVANFQKAISTIRGIFGEKHPGLVSSYTQLAEFYRNQGEFDLALENYQRGLMANFLSFNNPDPYSNPILEDYIDQEVLFLTLFDRAKTFRMKYDSLNDMKSLKASLVTYQLMDTLLDKMRGHFENTGDKIALGRKATQVYENAIETCLTIDNANRKDQYHALAFYFSEKNKAGALTDALNEISAKGVGLLPEKVLALEKKLKNNESGIRSKLMQSKMNPKGVDSLQIGELNRQLFEIKRSHDSLKLTFEKNDPEYFNLRYQQQTRDKKIIQSQLPPGTALIEYFEGEKNLYVFGMTKNTFTIESLPIDSVYRQRVIRFRKTLEQGSDIKVAPVIHYNEYTSLANKLYENVLQKVMQKMQKGEKIDRLLIIPDGQLAYIPFEILLTKTSSNNTGNYVGLDYLLKEYAITYAYSAALAFQKRNKQTHSKSDYLAFAPEYKTKAQDSTTLLALGKFRDEVTGLKWNQQEVKTLSQKVGGDYYVGGDATEAHFKQEAKDYRIIHLAMHALVDDADPLNSKLVFSQPKDSLEDGYLHAFELYNMQLDAQMVVLSACNTGYGTMARGEGIMSLARAFSYAGVPSVVMSHWKVDDEATSKLMEYFYEYLAEGLSKGESLRQAKLRYLNEANPASTNPFYWAAFVSLGNDDPIVTKHYYWQIAGGIFILALLSGVFLYYKRR